MAKLPLPPGPERLASLRLPEDVVALAPMTRLVRIYRTAGEHPSSWRSLRTVGPVPGGRFDPHPVPAAGRAADAPGYGVTYLGLSLRTTLAEAFQDARTVDRRTGRPYLAVFRLRRPVHLLDLAGSWPTRAGASQAISSGRRDRAQAWARAIWAAYPDVEGVWYPSAMDGGAPAVCLWQRAAAALPRFPEVNLPLDAPALALPLARSCLPLGYRLL
ncbi:MAG: RES family NAD+ phosphorylase [Actinomycetota bacterium]|nr:RES family NAD+ phosphorylase [Actinomycetota bacterium]